MSETWRDDLKEFVLSLDPDNPVLPEDFDPNYYDSDKYNTFMAWARYRPGTRLIPGLFTPIDPKKIGDYKRCFINFGYDDRFKPQSDYIETDRLTHLSFWILHRPNEPLPEELLYERFITDKYYTPLGYWIAYRPNEPIPHELYDTINTRMRWGETSLHVWAQKRSEPVPKMLLHLIGKVDCRGNTALYSMIASTKTGYKRILPSLLVERDIKCYGKYPVEAWLPRYPFGPSPRYKVRPPVELYPLELLPNFYDITINWRDNPSDFVKFLDPDNLELPADLDPSYVIGNSNHKTTLMNLWINYHPDVDIPRELMFDLDLYHSDKMIESPIFIWSRSCKKEIPDYLYAYLSVDRIAYDIYESDLDAWICGSTKPVPDVLWECLEHYKSSATLIEVWEDSRPDQELPEQLRFLKTE